MSFSLVPATVLYSDSDVEIYTKSVGNGNLRDNPLLQTWVTDKATNTTVELKPGLDTDPRIYFIGDQAYLVLITRIINGVTFTHVDVNDGQGTILVSHDNNQQYGLYLYNLADISAVNHNPALSIDKYYYREQIREDFHWDRDTATYSTVPGIAGGTAREMDSYSFVPNIVDVQPRNFIGPTLQGQATNSDINSILSGYKWDGLTFSAPVDVNQAGFWAKMHPVTTVPHYLVATERLLNIDIHHTTYEIPNSPVILTYSFPYYNELYSADYSDYPLTGDPGPNGTFREVDTFAPLSGQGQGAVEFTLQTISSFTNLQFQRLDGDLTYQARATLQFAKANLAPDTNGETWGLEQKNEMSGDVWIQNSGSDGARLDSPVLGNAAYKTYLHEIGHALGLKHPFDTEGVFPPVPALDSYKYTVMSYGTVAEGSYPQTFMLNDIAALQHLYGANYDQFSGSNTWKWDPHSGQLSIDGFDLPAPIANKIFMTVWDGGGQDTYDFSGYTSTVKIDLRPGEWSNTGPTQMPVLQTGATFTPGNIANAYLFDANHLDQLIENATAGSGNDTLEGNQIANVLVGRAGNDTFLGDAGDDTLVGGGGKDMMTGGSDKDIFDFNLKTETPKGVNRDVIMDFSGVGGESDLIDVAGIDANSQKPRNQDFKFIAGKFHHKAGELHVLTTAGFFLVEGDVNGDGKADFQIEVHSTAALSGGDFVGVIVPAAHQAVHYSEVTPREDLGWLWEERGG